MAQEVVYLTAADVALLADQLTYAAKDAASARLMIQDGGIKLSVNHRVWSWPVIGSVKETSWM
jgi:hypothetical protein